MIQASKQAGKCQPDRAAQVGIAELAEANHGSDWTEVCGSKSKVFPKQLASTDVDDAVFVDIQTDME